MTHLLARPTSHGALELEHSARDLVLEGRLALVVVAGGDTSMATAGGCGLLGGCGCGSRGCAVTATAKPAHDAGLAGGSSGLAGGRHDDKSRESCS